MMMLKALIAAFVWFTAIPAMAGPYSGSIISTATGRQNNNLSGVYRLARSSTTSTAYTIELDGPNGEVRSEYSNVTGTGSVGGLLFFGAKTNAQIQALTCANGGGRCLVASTSDNGLYMSTGSSIGQFVNLTASGTVAAGQQAQIDALVVSTASLQSQVNTLYTSTASLQSQIDGIVGISSSAPVWTKYTLSSTTFAVAYTTADVQLFALPAASIVHAVMIKHTVPFTGGGITAYTIKAGVTGTLDKYATAFNVFQSTSSTTAQMSSSGYVENFSSATSVRIAAVATGGNLNTATAGSVDVWVQTTTLP